MSPELERRKQFRTNEEVFLGEGAVLVDVLELHLGQTPVRLEIVREQRAYQCQSIFYVYFFSLSSMIMKNDINNKLLLLYMV